MAGAGAGVGVGGVGAGAGAWGGGAGARSGLQENPVTETSNMRTIAIIKPAFVFISFH